jgi:Acyl-CoA oxidase.
MDKLTINSYKLMKTPVFRANAVSEADLNTLASRVQDLMARIRPHAVKLVDSWMIPDYLLDR